MFGSSISGEKMTRVELRSAEDGKVRVAHKLLETFLLLAHTVYCKWSLTPTGSNFGLFYDEITGHERIPC